VISKYGFTGHYIFVTNSKVVSYISSLKVEMKRMGQKCDVGVPGWLSQLSVPTLDLSSGLELRVVSSSPALGSTPTFKKREKEKERNSDGDGGFEIEEEADVLMKMHPCLLSLAVSQPQPD